MAQHWKALIAGSYKVPTEATIPLWDWRYGKHLLRFTVSGTVATGGTGKSTLAIAEALAMVTGRSAAATVTSGAYQL